jgi:hypothetical protein
MREKIAEVIDAKILTDVKVRTILSLFQAEIEKLENKPSQYHYTCWASGAVKVRDEWGATETYKCHSFNGDFNCGDRGCTTGIIQGDKELTPIERHENWMLQKILKILKTK